MKRILGTLLGLAAGAVLYVTPLGAEEQSLRLNFDQKPGTEPSAVATLDDLLTLTPRSPGLSLTIQPSEQDGGAMPLIGLGFGDRAFGLDYELFASFSGVRGERTFLSPLQSSSINHLGLSDHISLGAPLGDQDRVWAFGGRVGYEGFALDTGFSRQSRLQDQAEYRDYRLGLSYGGQDWRIGLRYMRSLSSTDEALLGIADALELGGSWNVNRSVNLIGGIQFSDQADFSGLDNGNARDTMIFFGTRIQF